jgi:hypothetical protein
LVTTLIVFGLLSSGFLTLALTLSPEDMAIWLAGYMAQDPHNDGRCFVSSDAISVYLGMESPPDAILLGASGMRQAAADCSSINEALSETLGRPGRVKNLCTAGGRWAENDLLVSMLPDDWNGVLVIGVSSQGFGHDATRPPSLERLRKNWAMPSEVMRAYALRHGIDGEFTDNYFLDNRSFFLLRSRAVLLNALAGQLPPVRRAYLIRRRPHRTDEQLRVFAEAMVKLRLDLYAENVEAHFDRLAQTIRLAKEKGVRSIILVQTPLNPTCAEKFIEPKHPGFQSAHIERMREFAEREQVRFEDSNSLGFAAADFQDCIHLDTRESILDAQRWLGNLIAEEIASAE